METQKIFQAIPKIMADINAISKDRRNQQQGFAYRGVDDVMNELHSAIAKNGVFIVPTVTHEERSERASSRGGTLFYTRLTVDFKFYADDGSFISAVVIGEAMDSGDKASNKALSIAFKYACLQVFCIPTEDDKDPDAVTPPEVISQALPVESVQVQPKTQQAPKQQQKNYTPEQAQQIKQLLDMTYPNGTPVFNEADKNTYRAMLKAKGGQATLESVEGTAKDRTDAWTPSDQERADGAVW